MALTTRELLASVLGELPCRSPAPVVSTAPAPAPAPAAASAKPAPAAAEHPGPWRVSAKLSGGQLQISNRHESRVIRNEELELYLRSHGPAVPPRR